MEENMSKHLKNYTLTFTLFLFAFTSAFAQNRMQPEAKVSGGVVTLYALDPLARTFCFADGREGGMFQQNETRNRCSDIDFNTYNESSLTVGVEGGRTGAIIDLGSAIELEKLTVTATHLAKVKVSLHCVLKTITS
jgi:hypothetical protein